MRLRYVLISSASNEGSWEPAHPCQSLSCLIAKNMEDDEGSNHNLDQYSHCGHEAVHSCLNSEFTNLQLVPKPHYCLFYNLHPSQ